MLLIQVITSAIFFTSVSAEDLAFSTLPDKVGFYNPHFLQREQLFDPLLAVASYYKHQGSSDGGDLEHSSRYNNGENLKRKTGYEKTHKHDLTDKSKQHDKHQQTHYKKDGGNRADYNDEAERYSEQQKGDRNYKASKFGEKTGHKRGHKTKGYHNKFYRDEYHKEHKFYDDNHKSGHHSKEGDHRKYYEKKSGGQKKESSHQSGYVDDNYKKEGQHDKKSEVKEDNRFKEVNVDKSYNNRNKKHGTKTVALGGNRFGY